MSTFLSFLRLGVEHLLDPNGTDHILFIAALAAPYVLEDWRRLLVLVSAFTGGHTLTLALATLGVVPAGGPAVELGIALTILVTGAMGAWAVERDARQHRRFEERRATARLGYALALVFGLVHGLGFAGFLRELLGAEESLLVPLLGFNVGLELAQIVVLAVLMGASALVVRLGLRPTSWSLLVCGAAIGGALALIAARWPA